MKRTFLKSGHLPTLAACFLYFDISFMVWVILGPLAVLMAKDLHLSAGQKGLMAATPVLAGAVLRIVGGILVGQLKPKLTGIIMQSVVIAGLLAAWWLGIHSFQQALILGLVLGVAGASFAIALPMVSYWYPLEHQGTALGLAGAGNSGTVLASLFAPTIALAVGWQNIFGLVAIPLLIVLALFATKAKNSPDCPPRKSMSAYLKILTIGDAWWLMFFYAISFGGFVGLSSFLPIYFHDQYGLPVVTAGYFTAACVFMGSFVRPLGGALADRIGGTVTLSFVYAIAATALIAVSRGSLPAPIALGVLMAAMASLGAGNGAVFQLVPQRFQRDIDILTGLVGMTGGIGGFYLAASLGYAKQLTGSYTFGFVAFAGLAVMALCSIVWVRGRWRKKRPETAALVAVRV
jgi:NNP family nitrate/nitrite transporter-like MFS transporter